MTGSDRRATALGAPGAHALAEPGAHALAEPGTRALAAPSARAPGEPLLQVDGLCVELFTDTCAVRPVDAVSFAIARGRTLGIVGASGAGKTLTALSLTGLTRLEGARVSGSVRFRGRELATLREAELRRVRGRQIAFVFQDSISALHPLYRVGTQLAEAIRVHRQASRAAAKAHARELLSLVGIDHPEERAHQYPHELSGGQRQRVAIALALTGEPELLVADEPTTALDVTIQAQIVALLRELQREREMAILLISHDLGLVAELADDVCVMHAGRIVERGPLARVLAEPSDPHTRELLGAMPTLASPPTDGPQIAVAGGRAPGAGRAPAGGRAPAAGEARAGGSR